MAKKFCSKFFLFFVFFYAHECIFLTTAAGNLVGKIGADIF